MLVQVAEYILFPHPEVYIIDGDKLDVKNTICGNYNSSYVPSLEGQISYNFGSLYKTYKGTNYISTHCE